MEVLIDKRIELLTVIQTLCGYWEKISQNYSGESLFHCRYKDSINEYFEKYKHHKSLELYNQLCNKEQDFSVFLQLVLHYSNPPEFNTVADHNKKFGYMDESIKKLIDGMRIFYADTDFKNFLESNKNEYEKMRNDFFDIGEIKIKKVFEYLGKEDGNYKIIISPLVFGNFSIKIDIIEMQTIDYSIISPWDYKEDKYIFGDAETMKNILRHEIGHTVINDLTEKYLDKSEVKNMNVPDIFMKQAYNTMETIINEYIIRTITYTLEEDNSSAVSLLDYERKIGFTEIKDIGNYIKENCEGKNKLLKDENYRRLIKYVIEKIKKAYCV